MYDDPGCYWQRRLGSAFDLRAAGYAGLGPQFNAWLYRARWLALQRAMSVTGCQIGGRDVLEIGCGTGFYTELCRKLGASDYTGVDITAVSVQNLSVRYPQFRFVQADIGDDFLPITNKFDIVLAADVLFHIVDDGRFARAIANMAGFLRPGGWLVVSDVFPIETTQVAPHVRWRSRLVYTEAFAHHGLEIKHVEPIFAVLQPPAAIPGLGWQWRVYGWLWRITPFRLTRMRLVDQTLPKLLFTIDKHFLLPRATWLTPNNKWIVAQLSFER